MKIVYCNGRFIPEEEAVIPIHDRGFLFGDGLFTTIKVVDGYVRCLKAHLQRLVLQSQQIDLEFPSLNPLVIGDLIQRNHAEKGTWRLKIIATSAQAPSLALPRRPIGSLLISIKSYEEPEGSVRLALYPDPICRPSASIKSLAYLDRLYVQDFAWKQGCEDALVLGVKGEILETAFSNFFWRLGDQLFVPACTLPLLQGIALECVKQAACILGLQVQEVSVPWSDLPKEAHCFTCNALTDLRSVTCIGERLFQKDLYFEEALKTAYETVVCKA